MKKLYGSKTHLIGAMVSLCLLTACEDLPLNTTAGNTTVTAFEADPNRTVCDPLGGNGQPNSGGGLKASLEYIPNGNTSMYDTVDEFFRLTTHVPVDLYFNQLYVPTRSFDLGFVTQSGNVIQTNAGDTLYEFFGLKFDTLIRLGSLDTEGYYQFAVLSDDGAIMEMNLGNGFQSIVSNDYDHPTKMACASSAVFFGSRAARIPMKLSYYQGPRYHISLVVMWRKVDPLNIPAESQCGQQGNSMYWDYTQNPSVAKPAFLNLLDRGWKVLAPDNYVLPDNERNPCDDDDGNGGGGDGGLGV